jgi:hypothetical protein
MQHLAWVNTGLTLLLKKIRFNFSEITIKIVNRRSFRGYCDYSAHSSIDVTIHSLLFSYTITSLEIRQRVNLAAKFSKRIAEAESAASPDDVTKL